MVTPVDPDSLKEFGLIVLNECANLLLAKDPDVYVRLPDVDRADLLRQVIEAFLLADRTDLASALFDGIEESDLFRFSDRFPSTQLSGAKDSIEKGVDANHTENWVTSVDYNREVYAKNTVCQLCGIGDKAQEISSALVKFEYQKARQLAELLFEDRKDKTRLTRFLAESTRCRQ